MRISTKEIFGDVRYNAVFFMLGIFAIGLAFAFSLATSFIPYAEGGPVASAADDKTIALWNVRWRKLAARIGTHASPIYSVAFSPDGRQLASGEHDHSVRRYTRHRRLGRHSSE